MYREIIAVCSEIRTKDINTLCGQRVEFVNVNLVVHIVTTELYLICLLIICCPEQIMNSSLYNFTRVLLSFGPNAVFRPLLKCLHKYSHSMNTSMKNISLLVKFPSLTLLVIKFR
jgi:hypothetical protein